jgi:hypothetical protein
MIKIGKNAAGKERFMLTITGTIIVLIIAWVAGKIFIPKNNTEVVNSTTDSGFKRFQIKSSGYFYFDDVQKNRKLLEYKGVITETIKDTLALIAFNNDTLLYHKVIVLDKRGFQLKSIKDSTIINFKKEK